MIEHIAKNFSTKIILVFLGLLSGIITARWLGPDDRGVMAIITSIPATIWVLVNLGTNQASIYYINKGIHKLSSIVSNCFLIPTFLGIITISILWLTKDILILSYIPFINSYYLLIALLPLPLLILQDSFIGILRSADKFDIINMRMIIRAILGLTAVVGVLVIFNGSLAILIMVLVTIDSLLSIWMIKKVLLLSSVKIKNIDFLVIKDLLVFGSKSYIQNVIGYLHNRIDMYMIGAMLSSRQVAFYDISVIIGGLLLFLPQSIAFVILPKLVRETQVDNQESNIKLLKITFLITLVLAFLIACTGYWLIMYVYGVDYIPAYEILLFLLPGLIISSFNGVTIPFFTSRNAQKITIICSLVSLSANITLNLFFIPLYGAIGAAMVTTFTYSTFSLVMLIIYCKMNSIHFKDVLMPSREDIFQLRNVIIKYSMLIYSNTRGKK